MPFWAALVSRRRAEKNLVLIQSLPALDAHKFADEKVSRELIAAYISKAQYQTRGHVAVPSGDLLFLAIGPFQTQEAVQECIDHWQALQFRALFDKWRGGFQTFKDHYLGKQPNVRIYAR